jgi:hypothetical protein
MSDPEQRNKNRPSKKQPLPTASLSDPVEAPGSQIASFRIEWELGRGEVVAHWTCGSLKTF